MRTFGTDGLTELDPSLLGGAGPKILLPVSRKALDRPMKGRTNEQMKGGQSTGPYLNVGGSKKYY